MEQVLFELKEMRVDLNEAKQSRKQLESDICTLQEAVAELQEGQADKRGSNERSEAFTKHHWQLALDFDQLPAYR